MSTRCGLWVSTAIAVVAAWVSASVATGAEFAGGTGEPDDPYQIATAGQLVSIDADPNLLDKSFVLVADIDLDPNLPGGQVFTRAVIAPDTDDANGFQGAAFAGTFDGDGHTVRSLVIQNLTGDWVGLFGSIGEGAVVQNVGLTDVSVSGRSLAGALAGGSQGTIEDCYATGSVVGGDSADSLGGLVGSVLDGVILRSGADVKVVGGLDCTALGGLVGWLSGDIVDCHAAGDVIAGGDSWALGGLAGIAGWPSEFPASLIADSRATGQVIGADGSYYLGGLVGLSDNCPVRYCRASGAVSAGDRASILGGLVGFKGDSGASTASYGNTISSSCATGGVSGGRTCRDLGGLVGGTQSGIITNCCARGSVTGGPDSVHIGGLVGSSANALAAPVFGGRDSIANCYASGAIEVGPNSVGVGGLVGFGRFGCIANSFWDVESSGLGESAVGIGLTTAQMQNARTFADAGWDLADERTNGTSEIWMAPAGGGYLELAARAEATAVAVLEGAGTAEDPYLIATPEDLGAVYRHDPLVCYELVADINLVGITWSTAPIPEFGGSFEGAGHVISGLTVDGGGHLGLFGRLDPGASVTNLGIEDASIRGGALGGYLGVLAGQNMGHIAQCHAKGAVLGGSDAFRIGGLVGGHGDIGFDLEGTVIVDSYAVVAVTSGPGTMFLGGLVGCGYQGAAVRRCYVGGTVTGDESIAGIGAVVGGSVGRTRPLSISQCYFLVPSDVNELYPGLGIPLTEEQMRQSASFPGLDFETVWGICEGQGYPCLWWEDVWCAP